MPVLKQHIPPIHDQLEYLGQATRTVETPALRWRVGPWNPIDWSGTRARPRRFNNVHPKAPLAQWEQVRWWNSGHFAAVLISPMHAIVCRHYRMAIPSQVHAMRFVGRSGDVHMPEVADVLVEVGEDLDVVAFKAPLPMGDFAIASRIADMRTARPGLGLWLQTSQHMTMHLSLIKAGKITETGGATWAHSIAAKPSGVESECAGPDGDMYAFGGDSGSPCFCFNRWGRQCLVGMLWSSPTIAAGGTSKAASEFEALQALVRGAGYDLELCDVAPADPDVDGDGDVDGADLAAVMSEWGRARSRADVDGDGTVDARDMAAVLAGWRLS